MKRVLTWVGVGLLLVALALGWGFYRVFGRSLPMVDGQVLAPGVETVKDGWMVSAFVLDVAPGVVALVDCGDDEAGKALLAALARRGLGPEAVAGIFLTHGHPDHTAGCHLFPKAQVFALAAEVPTIGEAAKVTQPLKDGEATNLGGLHMETFATPGHTPGSAVYLADGVLFFGDSASAGKDGALHPAVRLFTKDPDLNVASLKALAARLRPRADEVKVLAFAHSGPLTGLGPLEAFAAKP